MTKTVNTITKLSNILMIQGKKSKSEKLLSKALSELNYRYKIEPLNLIENLMRKLVVIAEVRSSKQRGTARLIPTPTPEHRQIPLGLRLFRDVVRTRPENTQEERFLVEVQNIHEGRGDSLKKRNMIHQQVELNRANYRSHKIRRHYRW